MKILNATKITHKMYNGQYSSVINYSKNKILITHFFTTKAKRRKQLTLL